MAIRLSDDTITLWYDLCRIGPRPMGCDGAEQAVNLIESRFRRIGFHVERRPFPYTKWRVEGQVHLTLHLGSTSLSLAAEALIGCPGTSRPVRGRLVRWGKTVIWGTYWWDTYAIVDEYQNIQALVSARPDGPAIPQAYPHDLSGRHPTFPHFVVGGADAALIERCLSEHANVYVLGYLSVRVEEAEGVNLVASVGPVTSPYILVGAHYDSVYSSPGAYDNATGIAAVFELALRRWSRHHSGLEHVQFVLFGGEEQSLAGSETDAEQRQQQGFLPSLAVILDGMGRGNCMEAWIGPESQMAQWYTLICSRAESDGYEVRFIFPPPHGSDHSSYYRRGVPVAMFTFNDPELIHTCNDVPHPQMLMNISRVVELVDHLLS